MRLKGKIINFFQTKFQNCSLTKTKLVDDIHIKGMRLLFDIYKKCNVSVLRLAFIEEKE